MIALKFLARGAISPFMGRRWVHEEWVVAAREDDEDTWVRACLPAQLAFWLGEELWRVELAEPVRAGPYQLASPRARLVSRVEAWGAPVAAELAAACAWRARDLVAARLAGEHAAALAGARDLPALEAAARRAAPEARAAGHVASAARHAQVGRPAGASLNAAMLAAALEAHGAAEASFDAERAWQGRWLSRHVGVVDE